MRHKIQLEKSLREFEDAVEMLWEDPSLDTAFSVNIVSLGLKELFYQIELDKGSVPTEALRAYTKGVYSCLKRFQLMFPKLNGETRHVDLYHEQMMGRIVLVNQLKQYGN